MTEGARIVEEPLSLAEEIRAALRDSDGAVATFVGVVRNENEGLPVDAVEYSAYAPMAERELARIEEELARDYPDTLTRIRHRIGTLRVGEESVAIEKRCHRQADLGPPVHHARDSSIGR